MDRHYGLLPPLAGSATGMYGKNYKCSMTKLPCQGYSCIEFFCGDANVSRSMKYGMVACASLDILKGNAPMRTHQQNAFDLGTPAGLVFFASRLIELFFLWG